MQQLAQIAELNLTRSGTYRFLARAYRSEVDPEFLDQMLRLDQSTAVDDHQMREGFEQLENYLSGRSIGTLTELAVEYVGIFIGAGTTPALVAFPYESVYTSPDRLVMQQARDEVRKVYYEAGLQRAEGYVEPEDHMAFELEFMAFLCQKTRSALECSDLKGARWFLIGQNDFITLHLGKWAPAFCADVDRAAGKDFYKAIAKITRGFLEMDRIVIPQMLLQVQAD